MTSVTHSLSAMQNYPPCYTLSALLAMTSHVASDPIDSQIRSRAVQAAQGQLPFDILITGATLVDVFTGELRPADIGIIGPMIASVHSPGSRNDAAVIHRA